MKLMRSHPACNAGRVAALASILIATPTASAQFFCDTHNYRVCQSSQQECLEVGQPPCVEQAVAYCFTRHETDDDGQPITDPYSRVNWCFALLQRCNSFRVGQINFARSRGHTVEFSDCERRISMTESPRSTRRIATGLCDGHPCQPSTASTGIEQPCGGTGQPCCSEGDPMCRQGLLCSSTLSPRPLTTRQLAAIRLRCIPCGERGQASCDGAGTRDGSHYCSRGLTPVESRLWSAVPLGYGTTQVCLPCGARSQPCCDFGNESCGLGLACVEGAGARHRCVPCGGRGQPCCGGDSCNGSLSCHRNDDETTRCSAANE